MKLARASLVDSQTRISMFAFVRLWAATPSAIRTADEHAIKFVEACVGEYRRNPDPVFVAAAANAAARLAQ